MIVKINVAEVLIHLQWNDFKPLFAEPRLLEVPYYKEKYFRFLVVNDEKEKPSNMYTDEGNFFIYLYESDIPRRANIFPQVIQLPVNKEEFKVLTFRCPFDISNKDIKEMCFPNQQIIKIKRPPNKKSYFVT